MTPTDSAAADPVAPPDPAFPALARNASFRYMWVSEAVSVLGTSTTTVLLPLLAIQAFGAGPGWMGALTAALWLPWLLIGLPAGAWVDHRDSRRVMIASDVFSGVVLASVPLAWWLGVLTMWQLLAVALLSGASSVFFRAAYPGLLTRVVRDEDLESANSRLVTAESVMDVAGPGAGGVIAQVTHAAWGMGLDALSFLVSAFCLSRVRTAAAPPPPPDAAEPLGDRIRAGVRLIWHDRLLRYFMLQGGVSNLGLTGYSALLVLFLTEQVGLDPALLGAVMMVGSLGGILGAMAAPGLSARIGSARTVVLLTMIGGPTALLIALGAPGPAGIAAVVLGLGLVSFGVLGENVVKSAWRQRYVPPALLARAVTTSQVVNYGTLPLAGALAGWLGTAYGVRTALVVLLLLHVLASLSILVSPAARRRDLPLSPEGAGSTAGDASADNTRDDAGRR